MAADPEMTLQGAINQAGEMIRERFRKFRSELDATKKTQQPIAPPTSSGIISSLIAFVTSFGSSTKTSSSPSSLGDSSDDVEKPVVNSENDSEIRKVLLNWVAGTIHWAYEVECFFCPNVDGDDHSQSSGKKKRGGEVRDYGWVFLIKEHRV
jgi:hypothetical protein